MRARLSHLHLLPSSYLALGRYVWEGKKLPLCPVVRRQWLLHKHHIVIIHDNVIMIVTQYIHDFNDSTRMQSFSHLTILAIISLHRSDAGWAQGRRTNRTAILQAAEQLGRSFLAQSLQYCSISYQPSGIPKAQPTLLCDPNSTEWIHILLLQGQLGCLRG